MTKAMDKFITKLMKNMTLQQKIGQLNLAEGGQMSETQFVTGTEFTKNVLEKIEAGKVGGLLNVRGAAVIQKLQKLAFEKTGIPLLVGLDVIHGHQTIFPIPLAMSCTWDMALIEKSSRIAAKEATADGINWTFDPMVDIARDARWGRIAEGSGEDTYLGCRIAEAKVKGYQGKDLTATDSVMACVKHAFLYGAPERGLDYEGVDMSDLKMMDAYLPPYWAGLKAGAGSMMTAFNDINGTPATMHKKLLTDMARKKLKFEFMAVSDYTSVKEMIAHGIGDFQTAAYKALKAGVDMEMVGEGYLDTLEKSLKQGRISEKDIDAACRRVLEAKYKLGLFKDPYKAISPQRQATEILTEENRAAARDVAARSCVLLKNDNGALPLKREGTIALIGPLADDKNNMVGTWAISSDPSKCVPVLEGIKKAAGSANILYAKGANITNDPIEAKGLNALAHCVDIDARSPEDMIAEAVAIARKADKIVAVVGESKGHSGEASSRADIGIPEAQRPLLKALAAVSKETGKPLVLVLMSGRPLTLQWEHDNADAMLMAWHAGTEAGNGIADVLFGDHNPSGRLTTTFPRQVGHVPTYYTQKSGGRPYQRAFHKHTTCYLDGAHTPLYPFGFGLSYTKFDYSPVQVSKQKLKGDNDKLVASVRVTNSGQFAGEEKVQLYITDPVCSRTRPVKELKGFKVINLAPGQSEDVQFEITPEDLKFFITPKKFGWEPGDFIIQIGRNCEDTQSATVAWSKSRKPQPGLKNG